jgi:hypothetical protein
MDGELAIFDDESLEDVRPDVEDIAGVEDDLQKRILDFKADDQELQDQVQSLRDQVTDLEQMLYGDDCPGGDAAIILVPEQSNVSTGPELAMTAKKAAVEFPLDRAISTLRRLAVSSLDRGRKRLYRFAAQIADALEETGNADEARAAWPQLKTMIFDEKNRVGPELQRELSAIFETVQAAVKQGASTGPGLVMTAKKVMAADVNSYITEAWSIAGKYGLVGALPKITRRNEEKVADLLSSLEADVEEAAESAGDEEIAERYSDLINLIFLSPNGGVLHKAIVEAPEERTKREEEAHEQLYGNWNDKCAPQELITSPKPEPKMITVQTHIALFKRAGRVMLAHGADVSKLHHALKTAEEKPAQAPVALKFAKQFLDKFLADKKLPVTGMSWKRLENRLKRNAAGVSTEQELQQLKQLIDQIQGSLFNGDTATITANLTRLQQTAKQLQEQFNKLSRRIVAGDSPADSSQYGLWGEERVGPEPLAEEWWVERNLARLKNDPRVAKALDEGAKEYSKLTPKAPAQRDEHESWLFLSRIHLPDIWDKVVAALHEADKQITSRKRQSKLYNKPMLKQAEEKIPVAIGISGTNAGYALKSGDGYDIYLYPCEMADGYDVNDKTGSYPGKGQDNEDAEGEEYIRKQFQETTGHAPKAEIYSGYADQWEGGFICTWDPSSAPVKAFSISDVEAQENIEAGGGDSLWLQPDNMEGHLTGQFEGWQPINDEQ